MLKPLSQIPDTDLQVAYLFSHKPIDFLDIAWALLYKASSLCQMIVKKLKHGTMQYRQNHR